MYRILIICAFALVLSSTLVLESCQHDPFYILVNNGQDSTDTGGNDTTGNNDTTLATIACDPDTVYFQNAILPLLISNCSMSGCHDATSHKEGVILTSYSTVRNTSEIKLSKPAESKLYRVLITGDAEDRMPQNKPPLQQDEIARILKWIEQGAKDNYCDECDSTKASYSLNIRPIIKNSCQGCHSGTKPSGNLDLSTYDGLKSVADNGKLVGAITHTNGFKPMPENSKLPECDISKIRVWVRAGALNN
jgi:hypothetical protein